ncbi:MAG: DnaJ domain-containing protein [Gemmataceae bacterium]
MMTEKRDYYEVLGVARSATSDEIRGAFLILAKKFHPDQNIADPDGVQRFNEARVAYDVLRDSKKREEYDRVGDPFDPNNQKRAFANANFGNLLTGWLQQLAENADRENRPLPGEDVLIQLALTPDEVQRGGQREVSITRLQRCETCGGRGVDGQLTLTPCTRCDGNQTYVAKWLFFRLRKRCKHCGGTGLEPLKKCSACLGERRIRTDGTVNVEIPTGIRDGSRITIVGEGNAGDRPGMTGDLYVEFRFSEINVRLS